MADHTIMGGKVHVYRRESSSFWQCSTYLAGRNRRVSTREKRLAKAKDFAEGWYLELRGKHRRGEIAAERNFRQAADQFLREFEIITGGDRNPVYVEGHRARLRGHCQLNHASLSLDESRSRRAGSQGAVACCQAIMDRARSSR